MRCRKIGSGGNLVGGLLEVLHEVGHIVVVIPRARFAPREVARDLLELVQVLLSELIDDAREQVLQFCWLCAVEYVRRRGGLGLRGWV